jgi:hypothetical protein
VAIKSKVNPIVDLDDRFAGSNIEIFEIKGSEDSRNARSLNFIWNMRKVVA